MNNVVLYSATGCPLCAKYKTLLTEKGITVLRLTRAAIEQRPFEAVGVLARAIGHREAALRAA